MVYACIVVLFCFLSVTKHLYYICIRDETILQYIDILQYLFLQYNTIRLKGNINILHTAIYCYILQYIAYVCCLNVVKCSIITPQK